MIDAHLTAFPVGSPSDLRNLDATLENLRRAERDVVAMVAFVAEARDALAVRPDDPEAARRAAMAEFLMRAEANGLALQFTALARPEETVHRGAGIVRGLLAHLDPLACLSIPSSLDDAVRGSF